MSRSIQSKLLLNNTQGAALVEFALISIPLFALIIGTIANILISIAKISLDSTLQAIVYDAANSGAPLQASNFSRNLFCNRATFLLVDCNTSTDLCISAVSIDQMPLADLSNLSCTQSVNSSQSTQGMSAYIVEYNVPNYLNFLNILMPQSANKSNQIRIRSVALAQPI